MCDCKDKVERLEQEIAESHQREAELFKTLAESSNLNSQTFWRPWQVVIIPLILAFLSGGAAVYVAVISTLSKVS